MTYNVLMGTLNPTHSLTHLVPQYFGEHIQALEQASQQR